MSDNDGSGATDAEVPDEAAEAQRLYLSGPTVKQVAAEMQIGLGRARGLLARISLRRNTRRPQALIPDARVLELREVEKLT